MPDDVIAETVIVYNSPLHLYCEMLRAHKKAITADARLHRGRRHRILGHWGPMVIRHTKWHTASHKWQKRFTVTMKRVDDTNTHQATSA